MLPITRIIVGEFYRVTAVLITVTRKHTLDIKVVEIQLDRLLIGSVKNVIAFHVNWIIAGVVG